MRTKSPKLEGGKEACFEFVASYGESHLSAHFDAGELPAAKRTSTIAHQRSTIPVKAKGNSLFLDVGSRAHLLNGSGEAAVCGAASALSAPQAACISL